MERVPPSSASSSDSGSIPYTAVSVLLSSVDPPTTEVINTSNPEIRYDIAVI
ncbi:hypothetical protein ES703_73883 [subsurface metagenome]